MSERANRFTPPPSYSSLFPHQPIIQRSVEEGQEEAVDQPEDLLPPSPLLSPPPSLPSYQLCRLSNQDFNSIVDLLVAFNMIFIIVTLLSMCIGFWYFYHLFFTSLHFLFQCNCQNVFNATQKE